MPAGQSQRPCGLSSLVLAAAVFFGPGCAIGPQLKVANLAESPSVELRAVPHHPQGDFYCGPASLLSVLDHAGVETGLDEVMARVYLPDREGSLQIELLAATRHFGRIAYLLPPDPGAVLAEIDRGRPVLVLLNLAIPDRPHWHYAVVVGYDATRNTLILRSGDHVRLVEPARSWNRQWTWAGSWAMVALRPGELPAAPDRTRLLRALADFERQADPEAAGTAWEAALEWQPEEPLAWLGLGNSHYRRQDWARAASAYTHLLELDPDHLPGRLNLASTLARQDRPSEALQVLERHRPDPSSPLAAPWQTLHDELTAAGEATAGR
ncbi:MAG: tetratricopeptide repeat protein [Puniceicoccaceae bacterium]|nr:MAG: tetratricopeptide repeat protein [Puniceicoccaceae bacterium]